MFKLRYSPCSLGAWLAQIEPALRLILALGLPDLTHGIKPTTEVHATSMGIEISWRYNVCASIYRYKYIYIYVYLLYLHSVFGGVRGTTVGDS